jgi:hypothetical protein
MVAGGPSEASDHRFNVVRWYPTAAAVAEEIHGAWYLVRDPAGVGENRDHVYPVVARSARTTGYHP